MSRWQPRRRELTVNTVHALSRYPSIGELEVVKQGGEVSPRVLIVSHQSKEPYCILRDSWRWCADVGLSQARSVICPLQKHGDPWRSLLVILKHNCKDKLESSVAKLVADLFQMASVLLSATWGNSYTLYKYIYTKQIFLDSSIRFWSKMQEEGSLHRLKVIILPL